MAQSSRYREERSSVKRHRSHSEALPGGSSSRGSSSKGLELKEEKRRKREAQELQPPRSSYEEIPSGQIKAHEDSVYDVIRENKHHEKKMRMQQLKQLLEASTRMAAEETEEDSPPGLEEIEITRKRRVRRRRRRRKRGGTHFPDQKEGQNRTEDVWPAL